MLGNWFSKSLAMGIICCVISLGALTTSPARATLIQANDGAFGAGDDGFNLTQDTDTGLEWLDLTLTTDLSYNAVAGGAGGFLAAGFSIATGSQVDTFFTNSGATNLSGDNLVSQFSSAQTLVNLLGCTDFCGTGGDVSTGVSDANPFGVLAALPFVRIFDDPDLGNIGQYWGSVNCCISKDTSFETFGVFLVRGIPEPTSLALFAFGLAGLGFMARRRRKKLAA